MDYWIIEHKTDYRLVWGGDDWTDVLEDARQYNEDDALDLGPRPIEGVGKWRHIRA